MTEAISRSPGSRSPGLRSLGLRSFLLGLFLCLPLVTQGQGLSDLVGQSDEFLPVNEAYQLEVEIVSGQEIRLYWQIEDDYYLYQHRFKAKLENEQGLINTTFEFSPALDKNDEFFGDVSVYYTYADIRLLSDQDFSEARLSITSQGCADAGLCYPPYTEKFIVNGQTGTVTKDDGSGTLGTKIAGGES